MRRGVEGLVNAPAGTFHESFTVRARSELYDPSMTTVKELVSIEAPFVQAVGALERRLGVGDRAEDGRCPLDLIAPLGPDRDVIRAVEARIERLPPAANYTACYHIAWDAGRTRRGIPTPGFEGMLTLRAGEDYDVCDFVLEGRYVAPGGAVGALFDEIAGRRIAHATLGALLDGVGRELQRESHEIESAKESRSPA
jgi:hypothetical protein